MVMHPHTKHPYYAGYWSNPEGTNRVLQRLSDEGHEVEGHVAAKKGGLILGEETIILPHFLLKAFPEWRWGNQAIGDCVSWASAHNIDTLMGVEIFLKQEAEMIVAQCCSEVAYGFMRVEVYGRPDRGGDGAYGGAAADAIVRFGSLHRLPYLNGKYDFSGYDNSGRTQKGYGRTGVPDELEPLAALHKCKTTTQVKDFETAAKMIQNGYAISNCHSRNPVCSGQRDKDGFATRDWGASHAMNYVGVRFGKRPGLLKVNSGWGHHVDGPTYPNDLPKQIAQCSWWEDVKTCNYVLRDGDSFAYSNYDGFKAQNLKDYGTESYL